MNHPTSKQFESVVNAEFQPFRDEVRMCRLLDGEPAIALLKYQPVARVPRHRQTGVETIYVLSGAQNDEHASYGVGNFITNPEGSEHSVWSDFGCVVLIHWNRLVEFLNDEAIS